MYSVVEHSYSRSCLHMYINSNLSWSQEHFVVSCIIIDYYNWLFTDILFQTEFSKDAVVKVKLGSGLGSLVSLIKK